MKAACMVEEEEAEQRGERDVGGWWCCEEEERKGSRMILLKCPSLSLFFIVPSCLKIDTATLNRIPNSKSNNR